MALEDTRFTLKIPKKFQDKLKGKRQAIAKEIVDFIRSRTQSGEGVKRAGNGFSPSSFPIYTKEYAKQKGTSRGNVDLTLTSAMLSSLEVIKASGDEITIGYKQGNPERLKAEGNVTGSYGKSPNRSKARNFIGITASDRDEIIKRVVAGSEDGDD